jgi:hypothetical protein
VKGDGPARASIRVDPQRRLLRHGPGRKEQRGLLAEQRRNLGLELGDRAADAVVVDLGPGRDRREELVRGAHAVPAEEASAGFGERFELQVTGERRWRLGRGAAFDSPWSVRHATTIREAAMARPLLHCFVCSHVQ